MTESVSKSHWVCPTCSFTESADALFCRRCGEERLPRRNDPPHAWLHRWWSTLCRLVLRPGGLTVDYRDGRRRQRVPPLSLFLAINLVFFVGEGLTGVSVLSIPLSAHLDGQPYSEWGARKVEQRVAALGVERVRFTERFDREELTLAKATAIAMAPPLALFCALLFVRRRQRASTHLIFALHFYAFALLFLTCLFSALIAMLIGLRAAGVTGTPARLDSVVTAVEAGVFGLYLFAASGRVYRTGKAARIGTTAALLVAVSLILYLQRAAVFVVTLLLA